MAKRTRLFNEKQPGDGDEADLQGDAGAENGSEGSSGSGSGEGEGGTGEAAPGPQDGQEMGGKFGAEADRVVADGKEALHQAETPNRKFGKDGVMRDVPEEPERKTIFDHMKAHDSDADQSLHAVHVRLGELLGIVPKALEVAAEKAPGSRLHQWIEGLHRALIEKF